MTTIHMASKNLVGVRYYGPTDTRGSRFGVFRYHYGRPNLMGSASYDYAARDAYGTALATVLAEIGIDDADWQELPGQTRRNEQLYLLTINAEDYPKLLS